MEKLDRYKRRSSQWLSTGPGQTPPSDWESVSLGVRGQRFTRPRTKKQNNRGHICCRAKKSNSRWMSWNKRGREEERETKTKGLEVHGAQEPLAAASCCSAPIWSAFKAQANGELAGKHPSTEEEERQSRAGGWSFAAPARAQTVQLFQPDFPPVSPLPFSLIGQKR